jgi:hypothetical protein
MSLSKKDLPLKGMPRRRRQVTYVKGEKRVVSAKGPGRNAPCPCGAQQKFKRCCKTVENIRPPEIEVIRRGN